MVETKRGKLILIEGLDRTGKTTQCELISKRNNYKYYKFPNRETPIGKIINSYLSQQNYDGKTLSDQSIHLLFSSNRWELQEEIKQNLLDGKNIILDRYVYSGVAYSLAKGIEVMDYEWCFGCDRGLVKPDLTIFLINNGNADNDGFGDEIYEKKEIQAKVRQVFETIFAEKEKKEYIKNHFKQLDVTGLGIEEVYEKVESFVKEEANKDSTNFIYF
ncbi:hypothetical protein ACO0SA_003653 [Hanseniaspora valbyensis]